MKTIISSTKLFSLLFILTLCLKTIAVNAQMCDRPITHNTESQPTYSGLTGWFADLINSLFGSRGAINDRQNGYDMEPDLINPATSVNFMSPAASWSGGAFDPITQIISSIRYSYRTTQDGSKSGDIYVVISSEGNLFNANILQTIELRAKRNGTVVYTKSFNQLAQWLIELGGVGAKKAYILPIDGDFDEIEIASIAGFGPNVQSLFQAAAPFMKIYDVRRIPKQPGAPVATVVNGNASGCAAVSGLSTRFTVSNPVAGLRYDWYDAAAGGNLVAANTATFNSTSPVSKDYYVEATVNADCQKPIRRSSATRTKVQRVITGCNLNADADGDGISNGNEGAGSTISVDTDGDGIPDFIDMDSDNDGIPDRTENKNRTINELLVDTDGDGVANFRDLDSDNDGINDVRESGGTSTDNNNDGRADGTVQANGIPLSAGANGTATPLDTDGDGKPNYWDLDSDNDGKSDLQESGNPAALVADTDNDGTIDKGNDPDNDGIMTSADGTPDTWGDAGDLAPKNSGPNTSDAPDYINPKSDGTNDDIDSTPYGGLDANNDGKIDNADDPDNDGIANVIDTKLNTFGGIPKVSIVSDLLIRILLPDANFVNGGLSKDLILHIFNVLPSGASDANTPIIITISKTRDYTVTLKTESANNWTLSNPNAATTVLTSKPGVTITNGIPVEIAATITAAGVMSAGDSNLDVNLEDGSGGDNNNENNSATRPILRN